MSGSNRTATNGHHSPYTVSVITSCHNTVKYVTDCVRSVQATVTCDQFRVEHIVVDDASTDGTTRLLHELAQTHLGSPIPLRVVQLTENLGRPSQVRNAGVARATGKYLFCLDDDDVLVQNALRYFLEHFERHPAERVAYADFLRGGPNLEYMVGFDYYGWPHATPQELLYSVFKGEHFYQHSLMFERSLFREVGGYDPAIRIGEDLDLCVRFALRGYVPTHLHFNSHIHRDHGRNMTAHFGWNEHIQDVTCHYDKHREALAGVLTAEQVFEIETILNTCQSTVS